MTTSVLTAIQSFFSTAAAMTTSTFSTSSRPSAGLFLARHTSTAGNSLASCAQNDDGVILLLHI